MNINRFLIPLFLFLFSTLTPSDAFSADEAYMNELIGSAKAQALYNDRYWDVLLSYREASNSRESLIDDPRFFLSKTGKTDPEAELAATIKSFFEEDAKENEHPRCTFPARYEWLRQKLDIDESRLPSASCPEFEDALGRVNPKSAVLVFPASFINSPASMFGHTLIRLDSDYESKLLSYSVSYAAQTDETNGFAFAFKGIFGYYHGYYSILPYYEKVKDYNDLDQRDIWEYSLNLTEEEVRRMFLHVWELKDIYSYYYFFDENCAYVLLDLLEAARPSVNLTNRFGFWVIPVDTIRAVNEAGLVEEVAYRPAKATRIRHIASLMDRDSRKTALRIIDKKIRPDEIVDADMEDEKKIRILDLASEFIQYKYAKRKTESSDYTKHIIETLTARSKLGRPEASAYRFEAPARPESGHASGRFSLGAGTREDVPFGEIKYRPAYHDLLDPDDGFLPGSQIVFTEVALRYYDSEERFALHRFDIINIASLTPRSLLFKPLSWKVSTGFAKKTVAEDKENTIYRLNPGGGYSWQAGPGGIAYFFIETDLNVGGVLDKDYAFGIGASAGVLAKIGDIWKFDLNAKAISYELGDEHEFYEAALNQNFRISGNQSISVGLSWNETFDIEQREASLAWNLYL